MHACRFFRLYAIIIGQAKKGDDTMKNIDLSACEEMIMTIIWNNEAELDLAAVMTQTNERYHRTWSTGREASFCGIPLCSQVVDSKSNVLSDKKPESLFS